MAWRVEEACLNARPSTREIVLGGHWLLRLDGSPTRRANSINPLQAPSYGPRPILEAARELYQAHAQPCLFRVPSITTGLDEWLERAGFSASGEVSTLYTTLDRAEFLGDPQIDIAPEPSEAWLAAINRLNPKVAVAPQSFRLMTAAILLPKAFVEVSHGGSIVGIAYGAIHDGLLVVESVAVDTKARRSGYGRRLVAALMVWARSRGAHAACLQVEAGNVAALALYRSLDFATELYRYHYRLAANDRSQPFFEELYRPPDTVMIDPSA